MEKSTSENNPQTKSSAWEIWICVYSVNISFRKISWIYKKYCENDVVRPANLYEGKIETKWDGMRRMKSIRQSEVGH